VENSAELRSDTNYRQTDCGDFSTIQITTSRYRYVPAFSKKQYCPWAFGRYGIRVELIGDGVLNVNGGVVWFSILLPDRFVNLAECTAAGTAIFLFGYAFSLCNVSLFSVAKGLKI